MARPKEKRNRLFIEDWKRGSSEKQLGQKYHLTIGGVKGLKSRLRKKDSSLYTGKQKGEVKQSSKKVTSPSTTTQTATSTKRMTFWLFKDMIEKIKAKGAREGKTASEIARELFSKHLKPK